MILWLLGKVKNDGVEERTTRCHARPTEKLVLPSLQGATAVYKFHAIVPQVRVPAGAKGLRRNTQTRIEDLCAEPQPTSRRSLELGGMLYGSPLEQRASCPRLTRG